MKEALEGQTVITYYNKRNYRIDEVDFSQNPTCSFQLKDGSSTSYIDYYYKKY
jgi:aubergine-like protein